MLRTNTPNAAIFGCLPTISNQIKSNQIYLPTQNMKEKKQSKTRSKAKGEKQLQTRVLAGLKGRKTAIT